MFKESIRVMQNEINLYIALNRAPILHLNLCFSCSMIKAKEAKSSEETFHTCYNGIVQGGSPVLGETKHITYLR